MKKWLVLFLITCLPIPVFADTSEPDLGNNIEGIEKDFFAQELKYISNQIIAFSCMSGTDAILCQIIHFIIFLISGFKFIVEVIGGAIFLVWVYRKINKLKIKLRKFLKKVK